MPLCHFVPQGQVPRVQHRFARSMRANSPGGVRFWHTVTDGEAVSAASADGSLARGIADGRGAPMASHRPIRPCSSSTTIALLVVARLLARQMLNAARRVRHTPLTPTPCKRICPLPWPCAVSLATRASSWAYVWRLAGASGSLDPSLPRGRRWPSCPSCTRKESRRGSKRFSASNPTPGSCSPPRNYRTRQSRSSSRRSSIRCTCGKAGRFMPVNAPGAMA